MKLTKYLVGGTVAAFVLWICADFMVGIGNDQTWLRSYEPLRLPILAGLVLAINALIVVVYLVDLNSPK